MYIYIAVHISSGTRCTAGTCRAIRWDRDLNERGLCAHDISAKPPTFLMADAPRIAPIAQSDVRRIAGAQVVPDMRSAVKELIENALDAGATSIGALA